MIVLCEITSLGQSMPMFSHLIRDCIALDKPLNILPTDQVEVFSLDCVIGCLWEGCSRGNDRLPSENFCSWSAVSVSLPIFSPICGSVCRALITLAFLNCFKILKNPKKPRRFDVSLSSFFIVGEKKFICNGNGNGNGNGIYIPHFLYVDNQMRFTFNHPTHES